MEERKFEEDIVSDLTSKFSISTDLQVKDSLNLNTLKDVLTIFPNLTLGNIQDNQLVNVNDRIVKETSYKLGKLLFNGVKKADVGYSLWNDPTNGNKPIIGEFDIDIKVADLIVKDGDIYDNTFNDPAVSVINTLY